MKIDIRDGFGFGGLALASIGIALIYFPLALIAVGSTLMHLGLRHGNIR